MPDFLASLTLQDYLTIITGIIAAAAAVASVTPTPRDDKLLRKAKRVLDVVALNVGKARNKED